MSAQETFSTILAGPEVAAVAAAAGAVPAYLVGGAVRDALIGREPADLDLDIAIEAELAPLIEALRAAGAELLDEHSRFGTASLAVGERRVDLSRCRSERYAEPGALPEVSPAGLEADLARRDFTVNAMAVPLVGDFELIDPHDGLGDLEIGQLRVIHPDSFRDDPTRALRAARYCARLGLSLEPQTAELLAATEMTTVSADRVAAELRRTAAEPNAVTAFALIERWGLVHLGGRMRLPLMSAIDMLAQPGSAWSELVERPRGPDPGPRALRRRARRARGDRPAGARPAIGGARPRGRPRRRRPAAGRGAGWRVGARAPDRPAAAAADRRRRPDRRRRRAGPGDRAGGWRRRDAACSTAPSWPASAASSPPR